MSSTKRFNPESKKDFYWPERKTDEPSISIPPELQHLEGIICPVVLAIFSSIMLKMEILLTPDHVFFLLTSILQRRNKKVEGNLFRKAITGSYKVCSSRPKKLPAIIVFTGTKKDYEKVLTQIKKLCNLANLNGQENNLWRFYAIRLCELAINQVSQKKVSQKKASQPSICLLSLTPKIENGKVAPSSKFWGLIALLLSGETFGDIVPNNSEHFHIIENIVYEDSTQNFSEITLSPSQNRVPNDMKFQLNLRVNGDKQQPLFLIAPYFDQNNSDVNEDEPPAGAIPLKETPAGAIPLKETPAGAIPLEETPAGEILA